MKKKHIFYDYAGRNFNQQIYKINEQRSYSVLEVHIMLSILYNEAHFMFPLKRQPCI